MPQVVEEPDAVESQHGGQRVGMRPPPALGWMGQMRSANICQGIKSSIRSRKRFLTAGLSLLALALPVSVKSPPS